MDIASTRQDPAPASSQERATASAPAPLFRRVFSRHTMNVALLLLIVMLMTRTLRMPGDLVSDPDLWWHLADARILCQTHHFIHVEPYSFTVAGQPWVNPEWLSELPYWFAYQSFHLSGLFFLTLLALFANLVFIYWRCCRTGHHAGAAFWAAAAGFPLMTVNGGPRTIILAYLLMSAEMAILDAAARGKPRALWLLPLVFCIWINLHGSWLIGFCLFVLYILCEVFAVNAGIFQQQALTSADRNRLVQVLAVSFAALFVNPYGWLLLWNPVDMMMNQKLSHATVQEWHPLSLSSLPGMGAIVVIALTVLANSLSSRKWKVYQFAFLAFAWFAAFDHSRFTFLAAVITIPMLAGDMARAFFTEPDTKTIPAMNALMVAGSLGIVAYLIPSQAILNRALSVEFPLKTIASIQPGWRTFNADAQGGMINFDCKPSFIDSRFDTFDHHGVLADYMDIMELRNSLDLLNKYRIDHVLLPRDMALSYLLERMPGWTVAQREGTGTATFELFARTSGPTASSIPGSNRP